ncbi:helix-turn-helix domain-containing protein [Roseivirga sp. E12]|uniref:AraC family transcriptional regulator n=1 Tax=Roseivirga sp. E12 TaxID=2819237 RepID=UPI001ABC9675|nr:helix-turn-helix domain-containing protein [Roseivirga sp. E12]MBO3697013.1 AraC family transcriptional regulator [Roseivirga sp. E12]
MSFWPLFFFAVGFQGVFLAVILFAQRRSNQANIYLALLILLFSVSTIDTVIFWITCECDSPGWLGLSLIFTFLYGPLFYLYLIAFDKREVSLKGRWKDFLPALIVLAWHAQYIILRLTKPQLISEWNSSLFSSYLLPLAGLGSLLFYAYCVYKFILRLEKKHATEILKSWHWLGLIFKAYLFFVLFHFIYFASIALGKSTRLSDTAIVLGYSIFIYSIGYLALKTSKLLNGIKVSTNKYQSTSLPQSFSRSMFEKLEAHMRLNKPYKQNEIKLAVLAEELSLAPYQLSQIINEHANRNFAEYINVYRVDEAIALISQIDRVNELAFEVGFNNRTSFNREFKKRTGLTPTEFKKR